jgi:hypothetical protein
MTLNFEAYLTDAINYFQYNIYIVIALAGVLLFLLSRRPKFFFSLVLIVAINISLLYVISYTSSLGENQKRHFIQINEPHVKFY